MCEEEFAEIRRRVIQRIDVTKECTDDEIREIIDEEVIQFCKNHQGDMPSIQERLICRNELFDSIRGYDILEKLLFDDDITEIMINGPNDIFIEKSGELYEYPGKFSSKERLSDVIQQIVSSVNRRVNEASPIVDTRLPDGSRVNVVLAPVALNGPIVTIRKFGKEAMKMEDLIRFGAIDDKVAEFLKILVKSRYNIFVSGGTGSGKTTFLNVLSNYIPSDERIITIEDSAELRIESIRNLVRLEVKQENAEGENGISIGDLIKSSLRMRPDRIIIGEVRGGEAFYLLSAMNSGHDGSLSTGHANSAADMLKRLMNMILMGIEMPLEAIKSQVASGIDIIIHLSRLRDRSRKVMEIVEVGEYKNGEIEVNPIYQFQEELEEIQADKVLGHLCWTGNRLRNVGKLQAAGYRPEALEYGSSNQR